MTSTITNGIDYTFISFEILTFYSNYDLAFGLWLLSRLSAQSLRETLVKHAWTTIVQV